MTDTTEQFYRDLVEVIAASHGAVLFYEGPCVSVAEAVKFGTAVMLGKVLIVVAIGGAVIPETLRRAATKVIKARTREHAASAAIQRRIVEAVHGGHKGRAVVIADIADLTAAERATWLEEGGTFQTEPPRQPDPFHGFKVGKS